MPPHSCRTICNLTFVSGSGLDVATLSLLEINDTSNGVEVLAVHLLRCVLKGGRNENL